ncbi:hypothetical protein DFJ58DRAFT_893324 [Suillus subalutaceus]|uniref:uncharacterized protein n=1 Tax=Suillus subalutaceus TaxID=48586 RepID=UPI001B866B4B|nr:uncharacterized protein DFJ58DRAFT_893324 [Suillus subalutaceus]KAG1845867.1 hypothetical protein DFJ58DRAFT_893324 [Suillus subalutaceus]
MDLHENAETKTVTATFGPLGINQQDVNVKVYGNRLTISGESKRSDKGGYARFGAYGHHIVQAEDVHAKMEDGLLTVRFPKAGPDQQPQQVAIA